MSSLAQCTTGRRCQDRENRNRQRAADPPEVVDPRCEEVDVGNDELSDDPAEVGAEQQERQEDVGEIEEGQGTGIAQHPREHSQRVVLRSPGPAKLLLGHLLPLQRRVGVHQAGRLVHGLVALLQALVGEGAIVAHLEEDAQKSPGQEVLHRVDEHASPEGDRAAWQATDRAMHRHGGHGVLVA